MELQNKRHILVTVVHASMKGRAIICKKCGKGHNRPLNTTGD